MGVTVSRPSTHAQIAGGDKLLINFRFRIFYLLSSLTLMFLNIEMKFIINCPVPREISHQIST